MSPEPSAASVPGEEESTPDSLESVARRLGRVLAENPEHERFAAARSAVQESTEAQERIAEFEQLRDEYSMARRAGDADRAALAELKEAQQELHDLPVMAEYLEAQAALDDRLDVIADAISEPLEVDFAERASGCCED
jgi:cell fate (sporulation/competence/biofilm development) regulator YlbF (YheA/YmcA/DUF963 family)